MLLIAQGVFSPAVAQQTFPSPEHVLFLRISGEGERYRVCVSAPAFVANKKSQCLHSYVLEKNLHNPTNDHQKHSVYGTLYQTDTHTHTF